MHMPTKQRIPLTSAPLASGDSQPSLMFWEVSAVLKCPVVGVCLTVAEQHKLVRKAGLLPENNSLFDIHEMLVSWTNEENTLARRTQALLVKKYGGKAEALRELNLLEFMTRWETAFTSGEFAAELWAAASRPDMPETLRRHVFGCVHMAMHEALEANRRCEAQLRLFRQERTLAAEKFRAIKLSLARAHKEQRQERKEHERIARLHMLLEAENGRLKSEVRAGGKAHPLLEAENERLRLELVQQTRQCRQAEADAEANRRQLADVLEEMEVQRQLVLQLEKELQRMLTSSAACASCSGSGECATCPRRVLIVGGIARMESLYRKLVEGGGGTLDYHDGHLGGGTGKLEKYLQRADIVLCPVNCNSHGACLLVKNLCKKHNKPMHMLPNFSLSAVSRVIRQMPPKRAH